MKEISIGLFGFCFSRRDREGERDREKKTIRPSEWFEGTTNYYFTFLFEFSAFAIHRGWPLSKSSAFGKLRRDDEIKSVSIDGAKHEIGGGDETSNFRYFVSFYCQLATATTTKMPVFEMRQTITDKNHPVDTSFLYFYLAATCSMCFSLPVSLGGIRVAVTCANLWPSLCSFN